MDSASLEDIVFNADIPCGHLENVKQILWDVFWLDWLIHDVFYGLESEFSFTTYLHQSFIKEQLLVQKAFVTSKFFEFIWDTVVTIGDDEYEEIIFRQVEIWVSPEAVIVMDQTA